MLDGVFTKTGDQAAVFHRLKAPSQTEVDEVAHEVTVGLARFLEKLRLVQKEPPSDETQLTPIDRWYANVVRDFDVLADKDADGNLSRSTQPRAQKTRSTHGFEVHAKVRVAALDREARRRLVHYVLRPPFAHEQLSELEDGSISFELRNSAKARGRGSHVILHPTAFLRRLAWIIPPPFKNQIVYSGVFAGNAKLRKEIIPKRAAKFREVRLNLPPPPVPPLDVILANAEISPDATQPDTYLPWAELLRRTYQIDALRCERCQGRLRPIATISAKLAPKILDHLGMDSKVPKLRPARGPP